MAYFVNTKTLASIFDVSERRIQQLTKDGVIRKESDGKYDVLKAVIEHYKNRNGLDNSVNFDIEHSLLEKAKREKAEIELNKLKNKMHDADDIEKLLTNMLVTFRTRILSLPSKLSPKIAGQKNPAIISDTLTKELKQALLELSEYDPAMFVGGEEIEDEVDSAVPKDNSSSSTDS